MINLFVLLNIHYAKDLKKNPKYIIDEIITLCMSKHRNWHDFYYKLMTKLYRVLD